MRTSFGSLSEHDRSVVLGELLRRHPGLTAEAEEITTSLLGMTDECSEELIRGVYGQLKEMRLILPSLRDEAPEWWWYEES